MSINSAMFRCIDVIKVEKKFLVVSYEFAVRNGTQKWTSEQIWRDIGAAVEQYTREKKHKIVGHTESVHADGDIQLEITNTPCPNYIGHIFGGDTSPLHSPGSHHSMQLSVVVKYGGLIKAHKHKAAKAQQKNRARALQENSTGEDSVAVDESLLNQSDFAGFADTTRECSSDFRKKSPGNTLSRKRAMTDSDNSNTKDEEVATKDEPGSPKSSTVPMKEEKKPEKDEAVAAPEKKKRKKKKSLLLPKRLR